MHVNYCCPSCQHPNGVTISEKTEKLQCGGCSWTRPLPADEQQRTHPSACLVCGCHDLWRRKNLSQSVGVAVVVLAAVLSSIAWYRYEILLSFGILMFAAAVDMVLYLFMPDVLVCYRCNAQYLKFDPAGGTPNFNLEMAEKHRQEKIRLQQTQ